MSIAAQDHVRSSPDPRQTALFRGLRPVCIAISDHALRVKPSSTPLDLQRSLSTLKSLLIVEDPTLLSPAIADYVFLPLSHILRRKDEWTDTILELTLGCVRLLLASAWSGRLGVGHRRRGDGGRGVPAASGRTPRPGSARRGQGLRHLR